MTERNTGQIVGICEYSGNPLRRATTYDMARRLERQALQKKRQRQKPGDVIEILDGNSSSGVRDAR